VSGELGTDTEGRRSTGILFCVELVCTETKTRSPATHQLSKGKPQATSYGQEVTIKEFLHSHWFRHGAVSVVFVVFVFVVFVVFVDSLN
jgi:hypothetical protein